MSAKFPRGGGGAGPFLARSLYTLSTFKVVTKIDVIDTSVHRNEQSLVTLGFALEQAFSKPMNVSCFCAPLL